MDANDARPDLPDPAALGPDAQMEELRRRVISAVKRVCPGWLALEAEDIAQNVIAQLVRAGNPGEGKRTYSTMYLEKAAHGATVDEIRRRCRRKENPVTDVRVMEDAPATGADPERRASAREISRGIRDCITRLALSRRFAVTLHLQGCSVPETARRLGWNAKRAENLVYRGLADLRDCLRAKGLDP